MKTPEASLSLLCTNTETSKFVLRGKHLPQRLVDETLGRDGVLGPDSCDWHYVEGLREDDNPRLALAWDKVSGVSHNGRRSLELEHEVLLVDGSVRYIMKQKWPAFVEEQKGLLTDTAKKRTNNSPPICWSDEATLGPNRPKQ
jgi:hypothetical protein